MEKENNNRIGLIVLLIAIVLFAGGITFAFFRADVTGDQEKLTVQTGTLVLTFSDNNTGITKSKLQLGESTIKEFKIENTGTLDVTTNMLWNNLINTYTEGSLTYTFEYSTNETGPWTLVPNASGDIPQSESASDKNLAEDITIPAHATYYYQLTITLNHLADVDQTNDKDAILSSNFKLGDKISATELTLATLKVTPKEGTPNFVSVPTTDEGVYSMEDDYGTSYYYRGAATKNYVKFGKWAAGTPNAGKDMWWRIIRVNGDGSIRMIYDGTQGYDNANGGEGYGGSDRFITTNQPWNANYNDNKYVGWMFGGNDGEASTSVSQAQTNTTDSDIKEVVDNWYETHLKTTYGSYIADAVYCNDRSMSTTPKQWWTGEGSTERGWKNTPTAYGGFSRFVTTDNSWNKPNPSPKFTCEQENDMFTVNTNTIQGKITNGSLKYPVGLITADEAVAAGVVPGTTSKYHYLYKNTVWYLTMSPSVVGINGNASVFGIHNYGYLNNTYVYNTGAVAPVISLKAEYAAKLSGTGVIDDPYIIPGVV